MNSLFKIKLEKGSQTAIVTGFLIDKEGHLLTAGHTFSELEQINKISCQPVEKSKRNYEAECVLVSDNIDEYDIAILKLKDFEESNAKPYLIYDGNVPDNSNIYAHVCDIEQPVSISMFYGKIVNGNKMSLNSSRRCTDGDSGAPVLYNGCVISIIKGRFWGKVEGDYYQEAYFTPIRNVIDFCKSKKFEGIDWNAITKSSFDTGIPLKYDKLLTPLPAVSEYFIGRDNELKNLERRLFEQPKSLTMLVSGEGGIGKTTLAAAYCQKFKDRYNHIAWLVYQGSILDTLFTLEKKLNLPTEGLSYEERKGQLIGELQNLPKPCLLVIDNSDNCDNYEKEKDYLSSLFNFHILLTIRATSCGTHAECFQVDALDLETAKELFKNIYTNFNPEEEKEEFLSLYNAIGGNTLTLEIIAKNLSELNRYYQSYTLQNLLDELIKKGILN